MCMYGLIYGKKGRKKSIYMYMVYVHVYIYVCMLV